MKLRVYQYKYYFADKYINSMKPMLITDFYQKMIDLYQEIQATGRQNIKLPKQAWFEQLPATNDNFIVKNSKMRFQIFITELEINDHSSQ